MRRLRGSRLRSAAIDETIRAVTGIGLGVVHVPVDDLGIDVTALEASGARVVVVTPAHQSPTGVVLAARRRHALVDWARRNGAFIVEDDYDSEFRYDKEPVGVLQGLAPDRVFTVGTTSKALAPAVRLGWVVAPAALAGAVAAEKEMSDRGTSTLDQLVLAALLESGRYDRHLRRMRTIYASRRAALIGALAQHAPGIRLTGLAAGFHAVAHLPASADEEAVAVGRPRAAGRPLPHGRPPGRRRHGATSARHGLRPGRRALDHGRHRRRRRPAQLTRPTQLPAPLAGVEAGVAHLQLGDGVGGPVGVAGRGEAEELELAGGGLLDEWVPVRAE